MEKLFVYLIFVFVLQTNPANENDFLTLMNLNLLPREFKEILSTGFPRGFLGEQFGMAVIAKEHLCDEPVMWYKQLWTTNDQDFLCSLARDKQFNCFLFNVMAKEFILLMRFARMGPKYLIPEAKTFTINFLYQFCRMQFVEKNVSIHNSGGYCPNPCSNKTHFCQSIPNTKEGRCRINPNFPYRNDGFECVCKDKYTWSAHAKVCVSTSFILTPTSLNCYRNGTKTISHFNDELHCVCKKNYYGKKCDKCPANKGFLATCG